MEGIKRLILIIIISFAAGLYVNAQPVSLSTLVSPQNVSFEQCYKAFDVTQEKLFYLSLAAINANRFVIEEMQSKSGYILFSAVNQEFLLSTITLEKNRSIVKITPANNIYYFPPGIVLNIFRYIELNLNSPVEVIPKN